MAREHEAGEHVAHSTPHVARARLLLLSTTTGYQLRSFGDAARELGIELIFATDRCHALDDPWRDAAIAVRFHDEAASVDRVIESMHGRPPGGLVAVGDRPVVLAALIAERLGIPGNPPAAARASAHKLLAREAFARAGLPVPWYLPVRADQPLGDVRGRVRYPAVIKPVGLSGSRGVIRVNDEAELRGAFARVQALLARPDIRAMRTGAEAQLLIEGYIAGREYAIEGLLTGGQFRTLAIFDKPDPLDGPFFEETIYVTPPALPAEHAARIDAAIARAASALGLRHGPVHAECRVGDAGVFILEVAARPIGGLCSRVLRFTAPGTARRVVSLESLLLRHALGHDVSSISREAGAAAVMMIPIPRRGMFRGVEGEVAARSVSFVEDVVISARRDQLIEPLPEAGSYLGFIFARAAAAADAEHAVRDAHRHLRFTIDHAIDVTPAQPRPIDD
jgi:biotin carboxylase